MTSAPTFSNPTSPNSPAEDGSTTAASTGTGSDLARVAAFYDADPAREWQRTRSSPYHRLEAEVIHRQVLAALPPAGRILDIGSGPGVHALALARRGHTVALSDLSAASLAVARDRFREAGLEGQLLGTWHSPAQLLAPPGHFDAVLLFGPLYHLLDDADAAETVRRAAAALAPGGRLYAIFLTRTSVLRDLLKRGRFTDMTALTDSGYLGHGRYQPPAGVPDTDYMPPTRTHSLREAEDLLRGAGLEITDRYSLEGVAAWMRPYVDQAAADRAAFTQLSDAVLATTGLPELVEAGDHFLLTATRTGLPRPPAPGRRSSGRPDSVGRHRTVLADATDSVCFAPAAVQHRGRRLLALTTGPSSARTYEPRQLPGRAPEPWYTGGRNRVMLCPLPHTGPVLLADARPLPVPDGCDDVMGPSLVSDGNTLLAFLSARADGGPWQIYRTLSHDGGSTWTTPKTVLEPSSGHASESEHVLMPAVLQRGGAWWMWYAGRDGHHRRIHLATSTDGTSWQRHGIVLDTGIPGAPDAYAADCPALAPTADGGLLMVYGAGTARCLAAAHSADGKSWRPLGTILHRAGPGAPDARYAFYPALVPDRSGQVRLLYAGEDETGHWSLLDAGLLDPDLLAQRPSPLELTVAVDTAVARVRAEVPAESWQITSDSHGSACSYTSPDGAITQLRPSSGPVFAARTPAGPVIVKPGRSTAFAEREHTGLQVLARHLPVPETALHYQGDNATLIVEHLDAGPLRNLAVTDPGVFTRVLGDLSVRLVRLITATARPYREQDADHSLQTPVVLSGWVEDLARRMRPWWNHALHLNGEPTQLTCAGLVHLARRSLPPGGHLAYGTGDLHLGNVLVDRADPRQWWVIDAEFAGLHDLDQSLAKLVGSCLKHTGLLADPTVAVHGDIVDITCRPLGPLGELLLTTPWLLDHFEGLPVDRSRILGLLLPDLFFRLTPPGTPAGPGGPFGMAALALGARMTGHGIAR
ncbi:methyltransferase domain-containing protein [Streptomyces sp. NPDC048448]|uniref:methyltransferase domain-containing protein n=1 Tax=Streptomyces sp. NPDC048448 TaxID=3365554 RepID=UPI00372459DF